jgi:hypothetical protein
VFPKIDKSAAERYLDALQAVWKDLSDLIRRQMLYIVIAVALFELLNRADVAEFAFGPVKVKNLAIIQKALPVLIAYLFYELQTMMIRWDRLETAHSELIKYLQREVWDNDLDLLLYPQMPSLATMSRSVRDVFSSSLDKTLLRTSDILSFIVVLGLPFLFEAYASYRLIAKFGVTDLSVWLVILLAAVILTVVYAIWIMFITETD